MWAQHGHESAADLLVGRRSLPTWAVLSSMVATELSAATFLGVPDASYTGTWSYLELAFGALLGKIAISVRVIPLYHRLRLVSIYQLLRTRFGPNAQRAAALCFIGGRLLASGVRLFIAALAFATVTNTSIEIAVVGCGAIAALYTRAGGIRSVVWTDALQAGVFLLGAAVLLFVAVSSVDGGLLEVGRWAESTGRLQIFTFDPFLALTDSRPFGSALVGGFFLTLATHGTDHDMVQRLLAARSGRSGAFALFGSALVNFPLTLLFLAVGTAIAASHALSPPTYDVGEAARVVPTFAIHVLPEGLRGLVFAGLLAAAMSSLDSAICAIATTWSVDLARRNPEPTPADAADASLARRIRRTSVLASILLVCAALGIAAYHTALVAPGTGSGALNLVEFALSAMSVLYGGLLGVFGVAVLTRRHGSERGAVAGLVVGASVGLALFLHPIVFGAVLLAWTWWIPVSATCAAAVTIAAPRWLDGRRARPE